MAGNGSGFANNEADFPDERCVHACLLYQEEQDRIHRSSNGAHPLAAMYHN